MGGIWGVLHQSDTMTTEKFKAFSIQHDGTFHSGWRGRYILVSK